MRRLIVDLWNEPSSGLLAMLATFVGAVVAANVGVFLGADLGGLAALVTAFLGGAWALGAGQAAQGRPADLARSPDQPLIVAGLLDSPVTGMVDLGRVLKLAAVLVAVELSVVVVVRGGSLLGAAALAGAFLAYAGGSDVTQKSAGL